MLHANDISFSYNDTVTFRFPEVRCGASDTLLVIGESGTGKTTFLHLLAGLLKPEGGSVRIGEEDITRLNERQLDRFRGRHIGIVYQRSHFVQSLSVLENLLVAQYLSGVPQDKLKAAAVLDRLGIGAKAGRLPAQLSQGEQQRAAIARSLMNDPKVILADEPTSSLDDKNCEAVSSLLEEQASLSGAALVIVTHDHRLKDRIPNHIAL